eukprot:439337-Amphidinium_carterae.1
MVFALWRPTAMNSAMKKDPLDRWTGLGVSRRYFCRNVVLLASRRTCCTLKCYFPFLSLTSLLTHSSTHSEAEGFSRHQHRLRPLGGSNSSGKIWGDIFVEIRKVCNCDCSHGSDFLIGSSAISTGQHCLLETSSVTWLPLQSQLAAMQRLRRS